MLPAPAAPNSRATAEESAPAAGRRHRKARDVAARTRRAVGRPNDFAKHDARPPFTGRAIGRASRWPHLADTMGRGRERRLPFRHRRFRRSFLMLTPPPARARHDIAEVCSTHALTHARSWRFSSRHRYLRFTSSIELCSRQPTRRHYSHTRMPRRRLFDFIAGGFRYRELIRQFFRASEHAAPSAPRSQ